MAAWCSPAAARRAASASPSDEAAVHHRSGPVTSPEPKSRPSRLTPGQRLKAKREFDAVYGQARRSSDNCFLVLARKNPLGVARLGLSISARNVGNAVARNRVKRLIRESFRLHQHDLPAADIVVNARTAVRTADNNAILRSLERHWQSVAQACARS